MREGKPLFFNTSYFSFKYSKFPIKRKQHSTLVFMGKYSGTIFKKKKATLSWFFRVFEKPAFDFPAFYQSNDIPVFKRMPLHQYHRQHHFNWQQRDKHRRTQTYITENRVSSHRISFRQESERSFARRAHRITCSWCHSSIKKSGIGRYSQHTRHTPR